MHLLLIGILIGMVFAPVGQLLVKKLLETISNI